MNMSSIAERRVIPNPLESFRVRDVRPPRTMRSSRPRQQSLCGVRKGTPGFGITGSDGAVYSGTKFAVHAISEAIRCELHGEGIRVMIVSPGWVNTELGQNMADEEIRDQLQKRQEEIGLDPERSGARSYTPSPSRGTSCCTRSPLCPLAKTDGDHGYASAG